MRNSNPKNDETPQNLIWLFRKEISHISERAQIRQESYLTRMKTERLEWGGKILKRFLKIQKITKRIMHQKRTGLGNQIINEAEERKYKSGWI